MSIDNGASEHDVQPAQQPPASGEEVKFWTETATAEELTANLDNLQEALEQVEEFGDLGSDSHFDYLGELKDVLGAKNLSDADRDRANQLLEKYPLPS